MDIREQEKIDAITYWMKKPIMGEVAIDYQATAEQILINIIPLVRADTLRAISKEASKLDGSTYLVPDYGKFKALWEEFVSGKEGE